jgi:hypothetical protein
MPSLKDIDERKKKLLAMMEQLQKEEDMTRFLQTCQQMEAIGAELAGLVLALEAEMLHKVTTARGAVEVTLTPDQRARISKATGINMTTVLIADPGGDVSRGMPLAKPEDIEREAMRQATAKKVQAEAREKARADLEQSLHEMEIQSQLMAEKVARLREQPEIKSILQPKK